MAYGDKYHMNLYMNKYVLNGCFLEDFTQYRKYGGFSIPYLIGNF